MTTCEDIGNLYFEAQRSVDSMPTGPKKDEFMSALIGVRNQIGEVGKGLDNVYSEPVNIDISRFEDPLKLLIEGTKLA